MGRGSSDRALVAHSPPEEAGRCHLSPLAPRAPHAQHRSSTWEGGLMNAAEIVDRYRVTDGRGFRLADHDPGDTAGLDLDKQQAQSLLQQGVQRLGELQEKLYAQDRWAVLLIFQAMDAAGKDSTIKHVTSGVNPQGVEVHAFKQPSAEDLDHDFLWRAARRLPERG